MIFENVLQIEYINNYDFKPEIIDKYSDIIIDIFNKNINQYINNKDDDIQIILALYYFSINEYNLGEDILIKLHNKDNYNASCSLGVYYKSILNNNEKAIYYFMQAAEAKHIDALMNLAYYYLTNNNIDEFNKYNKLSNDYDHELYNINMALFNWFIDMKKNVAMTYFNKLFEMKSYRGYYLYATLTINIKDKIKYLMLAIFIKPKKIYIDCLKEYTSNFERYVLYNEYNIDVKLYSMIENIKVIYNMCPLCLINTKLIQLKCFHSICITCIKKYNIYILNKCVMCYS
jgi:hypothetical protein